MLCTLIRPDKISVPLCSRNKNFPKVQSCFHLKPKIQFPQQQNPAAKNPVSKYWRSSPKPHLINPVFKTPDGIPSENVCKRGAFDDKKGSLPQGFQQMLALSGLGYWVTGFRCFPWLGLNFHMVYNLSVQPSTLQLIQNIGNLPMVAKPLYGILSDALYIGGARRIPYISVGVFIQVLSWGSLALIPVAREALPVLMLCILLSNLGASIAEVVKDALVAEYGQKNEMLGLQSYAFMASAAGGILGNLFGGFCIVQAKPVPMFLSFAALLALQLAITSATREESLGLPQTTNCTLMKRTISESITKQYSDLMVVVRRESISRPLVWIVASIVTVPVLSGGIFCYQTQCLNLDPSVIGMSKVTGQLVLFVLSVVYDRFWRNVPMRKLVGIVQILYAFSLILDLILAKQVNLALGISNKAFVFCFSGVAETLAQFKLLPFYVLFAKLAPPGCEGSLMSFSTSALCLSTTLSGFLGVGLASVLGITSGDYSNLPLGVCIQFLAALLPLLWIDEVSEILIAAEKGSKQVRIKKTKGCRRRARRLSFDSICCGRQEREPDFQM